MASKPLASCGTSVNATLALLYSDIYSCHDQKDFDRLQGKARLVLRLLGTSSDIAARGAFVASRMYRVSDEADLLLKRREFRAHRKTFAKIHQDARSLDRLLGLTAGSFSHEVTWWYYFRLTFSKKNNFVEKMLYLGLTFLAVFREHLSRLREPRAAFLCSLYLGRAGLAHEERNGNRERTFLSLYWKEKIGANSDTLSSKLFMV